MIHQLSLFLVLLVAKKIQCFTITTYRHYSLMTKLHAESSNGVQLVSLAGLGDDHEAVGENRAKSVAAWLDEEWMPQEIHIKMGISVNNTYIQCRSNGVDDVA